MDSTEDRAYLERSSPIDTGLSLGHKVWAGGPFLSCCLNKDSGIKLALALAVPGAVCRGREAQVSCLRQGTFLLRGVATIPQRASWENRAGHFYVK